MVGALLAAVSIFNVAKAAPLKWIRTIELPGVEGRIDHMAAYARGRRLFVAALGSGSVEVVDLDRGVVTQRLTGLAKPQGVAFHEGTGRLLVAGAGDGRVSVYEGNPLSHIRDISFSSDADNIRYDGSANLFLVGYGEGGIAAVDPVKLAPVWDIRLPSHPESFQLEPGGSRIFVNLPDAKEVAVLERGLKKISARWPQKFSENFAMALDPDARRLFVAFRRPARLAVLDAGTGAVLQALPLCGDCDDLFYDGRLRRVYAACGAGEIDVFAASSKSGAASLAAIPTAPGARTALFIPGLNRLYLAVPHRGGRPSGIMVFEPQP